MKMPAKVPVMSANRTSTKCIGIAWTNHFSAKPTAVIAAMNTTTATARQTKTEVGLMPRILTHSAASGNHEVRQ